MAILMYSDGINQLYYLIYHWNALNTRIRKNLYSIKSCHMTWSHRHHKSSRCDVGANCFTIPTSIYLRMQLPTVSIFKGILGKWEIMVISLVSIGKNQSIICTTGSLRHSFAKMIASNQTHYPLLVCDKTQHFFNDTKEYCLCAGSCD